MRSCSPNQSLWCAALALVLVLGVHAQTKTSANSAFKDLEPHARDQIRLLQDEKRSWSWFQKKLDSQLIYALRQKRLGAVLPGVSALRARVSLEPSGSLLVDVRAQVSPELLDFIKRNGGTVVNSFPRYHAVRAMLPLEATDSLAKRADVPVDPPAEQASTSTTAVEGDIAHRADEARQVFAIDGTGVNIGVLSDSIDYLTNAQAAGDLPLVTVLPGQGGSGSGEGTAMLEIVHSLAPGASLFFATAFAGTASFAQNIRDLQAAGCRIIVDDVLYYNESPFQDGPIAQAVNDVSAAGMLFFSDAGNGGGVDRGTSGTWEGDFKDGGPATSGRGGRVHDFGGTNYDTVLPGGSKQRVDLFWADPLGNSTNDYDVYVLDSSGSNVVSSSTNIQDGQGDPYESISQLSAGERIVIVKYSGEDRYLYLSTLWGRLQFATAGSTHGHNASGAPNAFGVAATPVASPPVPFVGGSANPVESFSSDGPRRIFFNPDGTAITPGNYSSTGGKVLQKPDLTGSGRRERIGSGLCSFFWDFRRGASCRRYRWLGVVLQPAPVARLSPFDSDWHVIGHRRPWLGPGFRSGDSDGLSCASGCAPRPDRQCSALGCEWKREPRPQRMCRYSRDFDELLRPDGERPERGADLPRPGGHHRPSATQLP